MRLVDAQLSIPTLLLTVAVIAVLGSGLLQIVAVLVIKPNGLFGRARVRRV